MKNILEFIYYRLWLSEKEIDLFYDNPKGRFFFILLFINLTWVSKSIAWVIGYHPFVHNYFFIAFSGMTALLIWIWFTLFEKKIISRQKDAKPEKYGKHFITVYVLCSLLPLTCMIIYFFIKA